ncbi:MAG: hypothetical protein Q9168_006359 [Polycauliona sp. 1 TL-2023]
MDLTAVSPSEPTGSGSSSTSINDEVQKEAPALVEPHIGQVQSSGPPKARTRRRSSQCRTTYQLAHPPPSTRQRQRFRLRPKTLLQLQQVSSASRPIPLFDVLPSILFAPRLTWRVPRLLQNKQGLGLDDLVFVRSQPPNSLPTSPEGSLWEIEHGEKTEREVVAVICQSNPTESNGQCRTEIRFSHGSTWSATALQSGAYEFASHGQESPRSIARWVPKREGLRAERTASLEQSEITAPKFKFSLVDVKSRRHPVIANMSQQSIEVYDRYSIPRSPQATPRQDDTESLEQVGSLSGGRSNDGEGSGSPKTMVETDDELRTMIAITGIWVAFCEHWSPDFRYSTKQVISNEISELSSLRRTEDGQPPTASGDGRRQRRFSTVDGFRHRPGETHKSVLSSIPASPRSGSPVASPQRTASTSTTIFGDEDSHPGALLQTESPTNPMTLDHEQDGKPRMSPTAAHAEKVAEAVRKRPGTFRRVVSRLRRTRSDF